MKRFEIHALPGFLGTDEDWKEFHSEPHSLISYDLFRDPDLIPHHSIEQWMSSFQSRIKILTIPRILMGYSLGGRLAIRLLLQKSNLWNGAIIISAHPGLSDVNEKTERISIDKQWADRFRKEPWEKVMEGWNSRETFKGGSFSFERIENHYSRESISRALEVSSLGHQGDLRDQLQQLNVPILWIAGENDLKYRNLAQTLSFSHPLSQVWIAPEAGHSGTMGPKNYFHTKNETISENYR